MKRNIVPPQKIKAHFIEPMLLLRTASLPAGPEWSVEVKLDGYRALGIKSNGKVQLRSRNNNDFSSKYPGIVKALSRLPDETVIDGELVAFDDSGKPSFNKLQNHRSSQVRYSVALQASLPELLRSVREQRLEGLVAKHRNSVYEAGERSGAWQKMRVNQGQEFVIGGYIPSPKNFDALIFGYYENNQLVYAARTRNGFTPRMRQEIFKRLQSVQIDQCPFVNLPEPRSGRWAQGLTAAKMKECRWLNPQLVAQFEFVEWTPDGHLRHSKFVGFRDDKEPREVNRERDALNS